VDNDAPTWSARNFREFPFQVVAGMAWRTAKVRSQAELSGDGLTFAQPVITYLHMACPEGVLCAYAMNATPEGELDELSSSFKSS
jgi:hypothetical protein